MHAGRATEQPETPSYSTPRMSVSQSVSQLRKEVDSYLASRMLVGAEWHTDNHSIPSRTVLTHLTFLPHFRRRTDIKTLALVLHCLPSPTTHPFLFSGFLFSPLPASLDTGLCQSTDRLYLPLTFSKVRSHENLQARTSLQLPCKALPKSSPPSASQLIDYMASCLFGKEHWSHFIPGRSWRGAHRQGPRG
jgi:hypothetical protein